MSDDMPVMAARREICHFGSHYMASHMYRKMERIGIECQENYFYVLLKPRMPTRNRKRKRQRKRTWSMQ